ncbi:MAG: DUF3043 domain-containing protein [Actinomycetota bacterium]|nr:DUF3043 domain-containing protein [Actinomycetota bacterium]
MFRRRSSDASPVLESEQPTPEQSRAGAQASKGRPTPKRSEVERRRRQPYGAPPANKKEAAAQQRERRRTDQRKRMDAMRRGEEWALPARDRGPVKALARDYIDSRRVLVSEYILFAVFALVFLLFVLGAAKNSSAILYIEFGILALIAAESLYHGYRVTALVKQRLPGESTRGITWYIAKRAIRLRSSRVPPVRVSRGDTI